MAGTIHRYQIGIILHTGQALKVIVAKVGEIDALIAEIPQPSQGQATGLGQVNTAVNQQNAAIVEKATAAAANLRGEAAELATLVATFDSSDGVAGVRKRPAMVRPVRHPAVANPVRRTQERLAKAVGGGAGKSWEEF